MSIPDPPAAPILLGLRLCPPLAEDAGAVARWLPEAVSAIQGRGAAAEAGLTLDELRRRWDATYPGGETFVGEAADGAVVGLLHARRLDGRLVVDALTVRAGLRNRGYGLEMVLALEAVRGTPGSDVLAGIPRANGLAVYFWLRAGYRPWYPAPATTPPGLDPSLLWVTRRLN